MLSKQPEIQTRTRSNRSALIDSSFMEPIGNLGIRAYSTNACLMKLVPIARTIKHLWEPDATGNGLALCTRTETVCDNWKSQKDGWARFCACQVIQWLAVLRPRFAHARCYTRRSVGFQRIGGFNLLHTQARAREDGFSGKTFRTIFLWAFIFA